MPRAFRISDQSDAYFMTFQVIEWVDAFSRQEIRLIFIEALDYCRKQKGLKVWAYVIMTNHVHLILSAENENLSDIVRDLKRFTSSEILSFIQTNKESRREWMLNIFKESKEKNTSHVQQFWTHFNHAVLLNTRKKFLTRMAYIHLNPVRAGFVDEVDHWLFSSQRNYSGLNALIEIDVADI